MSNHYKNNYYTLDKIPKHRIEYIDKTVYTFAKDFHLKYWPLDFVQIILNIQQTQILPIQIKSLGNLSYKFEATTVYSSKSNKFLIVVNKNKIHYPFKISKHRRLNFTLAHELGHIYLKHYLLPQECKTQKDLYIEELEADEFAGRLLMPKNKIFSYRFSSINEIASDFNVSNWAVLKRLTNLKHSNLRFYKDSLLYL